MMSWLMQRLPGTADLAYATLNQPINWTVKTAQLVYFALPFVFKYMYTNKMNLTQTLPLEFR